MLIVLTYNTIARYFFASSVSWVEEMSAYAMIWLTFITIGYAMQAKAHLCIDVVTVLYPKKLAQYILLLGEFCLLVFSFIIFYLALFYTQTTFQRGGRAVSVDFSIWLIYLSIPLGHFCMNVRIIESIVKRIRDIIRGVGMEEIDFGASTEIAKDYYEPDQSTEDGDKK
jgi:TRAP-type C4-dicarboxylate transport system permease small subunit